MGPIVLLGAIYSIEPYIEEWFVWKISSPFSWILISALNETDKSRQRGAQKNALKLSKKERQKGIPEEFQQPDLSAKTFPIILKRIT